MSSLIKFGLVLESVIPFVPGLGDVRPSQVGAGFRVHRSHTDPLREDGADDRLIDGFERRRSKSSRGARKPTQGKRSRASTLAVMPGRR